MPRPVMSLVRFFAAVSRVRCKPLGKAYHSAAASTGKLNVHSSANHERTPMTAKPTSGVIVSDRRIIDCKCQAAPTEVAQPEPCYGSWRPQ
jgi:hypothetical protein